MNWYKRSWIKNLQGETSDTGTMRLYRGISQKFDENFDLSRSDAPIGYSTWTDNLKLAREYAGENGFVYKIDLPKSRLVESFIGDDGERSLFFNNKKGAGLNGISGNEYLVYHYHDDYSPQLLSELKRGELY